MASESCSISSSSSGDDFVPIFLLRKAMKSFRRIYDDKKRSTIRWTKRMQLKLSSMKMIAIQTWTCVRLLLEWGRHSGVSVESASWEIKDRCASVVLIMSSVWRKFAQRQRTARRSTAVAVDLPVFSSILIQLRALGRRWQAFLDMTKRPLKCLNQQQVVEIFGFLLLRFFPPSMDRSVTIVCIFSTHFRSFRERLKSQSSHPTNVVEIPRSSETDESSRHPVGPCRPCCSRKCNRRLFQRRRPTRLPLTCTLSARSLRRSKALELSGQ